MQTRLCCTHRVIARVVLRPGAVAGVGCIRRGDCESDEDRDADGARRPHCLSPIKADQGLKAPPAGDEFKDPWVSSTSSGISVSFPALSVPAVRGVARILLENLSVATKEVYVATTDK